MATDLFERTISFNYGDEEGCVLMRRVWSVTPWMVDAFTGPSCDDRDLAMRQWCWRTFGHEAAPIHDRPGQWQRGSATVYGWTWYGFATRAQLEQFQARWPVP